MTKRILTTFVMGILVVAAWAPPSRAGLDSSSTVIVMPARTRVVQLAFQIARLKDVGLVAYNNSPTLAAPLIHAWNGREWIQIGMDEYVSGSFLPATVKHVFVLGDSVSLPAAMAVDPKWAAQVHKTADLGTASLLNQLGTVLKFSGMEWRWLAEQNGLMLTDRNAERRRYGRWGKTGVDESLKPSAAPMPESMPPEPPVSDIKEPTLPLTPPPAKVDEPKVPEAPLTEPAPAPEVKAPDAKPAEATMPEKAAEADAPKSEPKAETKAPAPAASPDAPAAADPTRK